MPTRAALSVDEPKSQLRVKLEDAYFETRKPDGRGRDGLRGQGGTAAHRPEESARPENPAPAR